MSEVLIIALIAPVSAAIGWLAKTILEIIKTKKSTNDRLKLIEKSINTMDSKIDDLIKKNEEQDKRNNKGFRILFQDKLSYLIPKYSRLKEITTIEKTTLHEMHDFYHDEVHGNGHFSADMDVIDKNVTVVLERKEN